MPIERPPGLIDVQSHYLPDSYLAARAAEHTEPDRFQGPCWSASNQHPRRFKQVGSLRLPDDEAAVLEAEYTLDIRGCVGAAVETNSHGSYLGDTMNEPLWSRLSARGAVVLIDPTRRRVGSESRWAGRAQCSSSYWTRPAP